jgi:hypothetical protein
VQVEKIQNFVDLSLNFPDEHGMTEHERMSNLFAKWVDVLEFQHFSATGTLVWEIQFPATDSEAAEYVRLFDWLKFLNLQPPPDSCP